MDTCTVKIFGFFFVKFLYCSCIIIINKNYYLNLTPGFTGIFHPKIKKSVIYTNVSVVLCLYNESRAVQ